MKRFIKIITITIICTLSFLVAAQKETCPPKPTKKGPATKLAGEWFSKGEAYFGQKKYQQALDAFRCSLNMVEHAITYFNAAQAANYLGKKEEALALAKTSKQQAPDGAASDAVKELIANLEQSLNAQKKAEEEKAAEDEKRRAAKAKQQEFQNTERARRVLALKTLGVGGLALGSTAIINGAVFQTLTAILHRDSEETQNIDVANMERDTSKKMQIAAIANFVTGSMAFGAGLVLLLVGKKEAKKIQDPENKKRALALIPSPNGLSLVGTF